MSTVDDTSTSQAGQPRYGHQDTSFRAAGGREGIRRLVDDFYDLMDRDPRFAGLRAMHPADLAPSRDRLSVFLCGWLGGPREYASRYGQIAIPQAHRHLRIGVTERDEWLGCMAAAIDGQPYTDDFKTYLLYQLSVPAERSRVVSEKYHALTGCGPGGR